MTNLNADRAAFNAAEAAWRAALVAEYGNRSYYPNGGIGAPGTLVEATFKARELAGQALGKAYAAVAA